MGGLTTAELPNCCYDYRHEEKQVKIVETCIDCGEFILEGDECYDIKGMVFCSGCIEGYRKLSE